MGAFAEFANLELAEFVAEGLRGPGDVAVGFGLDRRLIDGAGLAHEFHDLIARPSFGMDSGVHDQAHRAEEFRGEAAVVGDGVLVEANLFAKLLRVKGPAFDVSVEAETVQAELGQPGELLLDGKLHVMAGNAFVIGDGFVIDERAVREIGSGHDDAAGALAVRSAGNVVGCGRRLEGGYGLDRDRRLGQEGEELRKFGLHLGDVMAEVVENLVGGSGNVFGIGFERSAEGGEVGEAFFFGDDRHLGLDALDLAEAELVDFVGRHVRGGAAVDVVLVALLAVGQRGDGQSGAAVRRVFGAHESRERLVSGNDVGVDGVGDLLGQALLVFGGDAGGIFFCRQQERIGVDDALALHGNLFEEKSNGHEVVFHAGAKDFGGLGEDARNLLQAGDVVLVVLDGIEGDGERQVREAGMDAVLLVDGHLVFFEVVVGDALLQNANEQIVGESVLVGEAGGGDGLKARQEILVGLMALGDGGERVVGELVVVAIVAEGRGALGKVAEIGFVLFIEESVLRRQSIGDGFGVLGNTGVAKISKEKTIW